MRNKREILAELTEINEFIMLGIPDSDITQMLVTLSTLVTYMASSAALLAEAGVLYNQAKVKAYYALEARFKEVDRKMSPMLAKDFISGLCGDDHYAYEFAGRVNSGIIHAIDCVRTAVSAEKALSNAMAYSQTR